MLDGYIQRDEELLATALLATDVELTMETEESERTSPDKLVNSGVCLTLSVRVPPDKSVNLGVCVYNESNTIGISRSYRCTRI
jgi:hypothetical protein